MDILDTIKFLFINLETPLMFVALAASYRIGASARAVLYMCLIMLAKQFIDLGFVQACFEIYDTLSGNGKMNLVAVWHLFFVITEGLFVWVSYVLLTTHRFQIRNYVRVLVITAAVRSYLHMAQGIEVVWFSSSHIQPIYSYGVPVLDYVMISALFVGVYQCYQKRIEFGERIAWTS